MPVKKSVALSSAFLMIAAGTAAAVESCGGADACTLPAGTYHVMTPEVAGPHPVVVMLHDAGGTAGDLVMADAVTTTALARGFAVIAPQGLEQAMADGTALAGWRLSGTRSGGRDDISFLERVIADAAENHDIDAARVLVTGYGHGAALAWEAACERPDFAAAFAPRNGGYFAALPEGCAGTTRILHLHAPVEGSWPLATDAEAPEGAAPFMPIQSHLTMAAASFGCAGTGSGEDLPEGWDTVVWSGCEEGAALQLILHPESARTSALQFDVILDWFEAAAGTAPAMSADTAAVAATLDAEPAAADAAAPSETVDEAATENAE